MKEIYEDEIDLKKDLDSINIRYGDRMKTTYQFIIYFIDNKGLTTISRGLYSSPIVALRQIPTLLEQIKLPIEDLDIELQGILDENTNEYFSFCCKISPYMYFKKKEINNTDKE